MKFKLLSFALALGATAFCAQKPTQNKVSNERLEQIVVVSPFAVVAQPIQQPAPQPRSIKPVPIQLLQHMLWQGELPAGLSQDEITNLLTQREN